MASGPINLCSGGDKSGIDQWDGMGWDGMGWDQMAMGRDASLIVGFTRAISWAHASKQTVYSTPPSGGVSVSSSFMTLRMGQLYRSPDACHTPHSSVIPPGSAATVNVS